MANSSNSTLTTNFNVSPYYDDYDPDKGFYRVLFKPSYAVQGRELNTMQTILQKQVDRFGKHIFREGSIVLPGKFGIEKDVQYIKVKDVDDANNSITVDNFLNIDVRSPVSGINAYVLEVIDGAETSTNTKTFFVRYKDAAVANVLLKTFTSGETLTSNSGNVVIISNTAAIGTGSRFVIDEGVFFAKEHFIAFPTQSVILDRYNPSPTCRVGFEIAEELINYTDDISLLDPALEASNYAAPGADRLKLDVTLRVLDIEDTTGAPNFVELFTIKDGVIQEIYDRPQYNILRDEMAKRTLDESGDYYVRGLAVRIRENLDTGINGGYDANGNTSLLSVGVEPGLGYVKGYEVGKLVTEYFTINKALTYSFVNSQYATTSMGNFVYANEYVGSIPHDQGNMVFLYDTAQDRISTKKFAANSQTGNIIGTARVQTVEYDSGVLGTTTGNVKVYLFDIRMNGVSAFSATRSIYSSSTNFCCDPVLESNNAVLKDVAVGSLLYSTGSGFVRSIRDSTGVVDVTYVFKRTKTDATLTTGGAISLSGILGTNETFPYGTGSLSTDDKHEIQVTLNSDTSVNIAGTVSGTNNTPTLTGSGTAFLLLNPGDKLASYNVSTGAGPNGTGAGSGPQGIYTIQSITSNTLLTLTSNVVPAATGNTFYKVYKSGDKIDLATVGVSGGARSVSATPSALTFDMREPYVTSVGATVTFRVARTAAQETAKILRPSRYVQINVASASSVTGPYSLGFSDVYRIRQIRKRTDATLFSSASEGSDVSSSFIFNNGQKDIFYDHATITPTSPLATTDRLLVELDYFEPNFGSGAGYFSVNSYPVDDANTGNSVIRTENIPIYTSPSSGLRYDLRNFLDFRPVKSNTSANAVTVGSATVNPSNTANFLYDSTKGLRLPAPSESLVYDYSYYLGRKDLVLMDKDGNISTITGIPAGLPITPTIPDNFMALASIYVSPYPSLATNYAQIINRKDLSSQVKKLSNIRFTMKDIGVLRDRIVNLEYYCSLNALEKSAVDMQILGEDGLNRFKNGIFVDSFRDHSFGDTNDENYRIVVDPDEKSIRPVYTMNSLYYDYLSGSGVVRKGDLVYLPYTETVLLEQKKATSFRNVELSSYRFIGNLFLNPETDVWVDTEKLEDNAITIGPTGNNLPMGTTSTWDAWQTKIVGYNLYNSDTGQLLAKFDATQKDLAYDNAYHLARNAEFNLNTIGLTLDRDGDSKFSTVVETVYDTTRTGTETFYGISENTENLGTRVVDVALIPYIRPQTIRLNAKGLKANTKFFTYFDGENMTRYTRPLTRTQWLNWPNINQTGANSSPEGSLITSDYQGTIYAALRLPSETGGTRFRVGTKEVIVTDSPTNSEDDASTTATAYFVSLGLVQTKQDTILTTRQIISSDQSLSETQRTTSQYIQPLRASCSAYSFVPKAPDGQEGVFITSFDVYFAAKHPSLGVWFEIREMNSAGGITKNSIPLSTVYVESADMITSSDASTPMNVEFDSPIFLYNNTQYALVIHTVGLNPDTYIWISRLGETDISTGESVTSRPLTGTFYTTNNNLNWDIVPDVDLKITFYRAAFAVSDGTTNIGTFTLGNKPVEKLRVTNMTGNFANYGDVVMANDTITLSSIVGSIIANDYIIGAQSNANGKVMVINGSNYLMGNSAYILSETVAIANANGTVYGGRSAVISAIQRPSGILNKSIRTATDNTVEIISSNGTFAVGNSIKDVFTGEQATVAAIDNFRYSTIDFETSALNFSRTNLGFEMKTSSNAGTLGSTFDGINPNNNFYFDDEKAVFSRSNEVALISSNRSNQVRTTMSTYTEYLSPVVDLARTHSIYVDNLVNANTLYEANTSGGLLYNKYISKIVTLAEGQDAEDLLVIMTAYRPPTSDVYVWFRALNGEDADGFKEKGWTLMEKVDDSPYSSLVNRKDFREFSFKIPAAQLTGPLGEFQYVNSANVAFTGFKYFALKVGLSATNSAIVPRVADLRAICLQL